jgi:hypothetical protein
MLVRVVKGVDLDAVGHVHLEVAREVVDVQGVLGRVDCLNSGRWSVRSGRRTLGQLAPNDLEWLDVVLDHLARSMRHDLEHAGCNTVSAATAYQFTAYCCPARRK